MFSALQLHSFNSNGTGIESSQKRQKDTNRKSRKHGKKHFPGNNESNGNNKMKDSGPKKQMIPRISKEADEMLGTLFDCDPTFFGFERSRETAERELPKFLIQQVPVLKPRPFQQDAWDKENQEKMYKLEDSISDVTELWETLKKMREVERSVMEEKGLVDRADHAKDLAEAIDFRGTCQDMCPIYERARRGVENNVVRYEKANPTDKKISRDRALKVFARPAAAAAPPLPSDVRPPHILLKTLDYVVENIIQYLPDCESFLWDRMRSIRQDFTYQNYSGPEAIDCNERIVRIHLLILHQMAKSNIQFSVQQELEQLHKSLITLNEIYDEVRAHGGQCPNEAEFRAYSLLSKMRDPEYDKMIQDLPNHIFHDNLVQLAITFRRLVANSQYIERGVLATENCMNLYDRFFQLIQSEKIPFLMGCFLEVYLNDIRFYAFRSLSLAVTRKGGILPREYFMEHLLFRDDDDFSSFCSHYSIDIEDGKVLLKSLTATSHLLPETRPLKKNWLKCVDDKLLVSNPISIINCGKPNIDTIPFYSETVLGGISSADNTSSSFTIGENNDKPDSKLARNLTMGYEEVETTKSPSNAFFRLESNEKAPSFFTSNMKGFEAISTEKQTTEKNFDNKQKSTNEFSKKLLEQQRLREQFTKRQNSLAPSGKSTDSEEQKSLLHEQEQEVRKKIERGKDIMLEKEKELQKIRKVDAISLSIFNDILREKIMETVELTIDDKKRRESDIKSLANGLLASFIREQIFFIFQDLMCEKEIMKNLVGKCFSQWKRAYYKSALEKEKLMKHLEESKQLKKNLGVGNRATIFNRAPFEARQSFNVSGSSSFIKSSTNNYGTPLALEENHFTTPVRMKKKVWNQLDLKAIYCSGIKERLKSTFDLSSDNFEEAVSLEIVVYSKNWSSIPASWLLNKFGLVEFPKRKIRDEPIDFKFTKLCDGYKAEEFSNVNLVVFNTGVTDNDIFDLEMKLSQDGEKMVELICGIAFNTNFKFAILLVYWESVENPIPKSEIQTLLKIPKIRKRFGNLIQKISIVKILGDDPEGRLINGLHKIGDVFTFELTERGVYNERRKQHTLEQNQLRSKEEITQDLSSSLDRKMQKILESEQMKEAMHTKNKSAYDHLQRHILASPKLRNKKLPVLLSDSHKSKYKTPLVLSKNARTSSNGSTISNASHLAKKMKLPRQTSPHTDRSSLYGTPIQPRNLINHKNILSTPVLADMNSSQPNSSPAGDVTIQSEVESFDTAHSSSYSLKNSNSVHSSFNNKKSVKPSVEQETTNIPQNDLRIFSETSLPESIVELKDLIASVKRSLNNSTE